MSSHTDHAQTYRIKQVARTTGLSTHVIRKWEARYQLFHPQRGPNGYRHFTQDDIQLLLYLKSQLDNGESIGQLAQAGEHNLRASMHHVPLDLSGIPPGHWHEVRDIIRFARHQEGQALTLMLERWISQRGLERALHSLIFPLLRLIGDLWHQGGISQRGEEIVSRSVRQHLITVLRKESHSQGPHALIACVPGDFHEIGPLTAAVLLGDMGWQCLYLGPNVSFDMLKAALRRKQAQLMILGCLIEPDTHTVQSWLQTLTKDLQPFCQVAAGGPGFKPYAHLLSTHHILYVSQVQDVKSLQPETHIPDTLTAINQSACILHQL